MRAAGKTSRVAAPAALLSAALVLAAPASAHWTAGGLGTGSGTTGTLAAPTGVSVPAHSLANVPVTWTASGGSPAPTGYFVTRTSGGVTVAACASSASTLLTATSCADAGVPDGAHTYAVTAVFRSWTAPSASSSAVGVWSPARLAFTSQPASTVAGMAITPAVAVAVQTAAGTTVPLAGRTLDLALAANPGGGTLSGVVTATTDAAGVATFAGLSVDKAGAGYTLAATSGALTAATSSAFTITAATADRFVFTSAAVTGTASATATLGPITVQRQDALGNPTAPGSAVSVNLSSTSTGGSFSATSAGPSTTSVTIPAFASSATFFYGDTRSGAPTLTASGSLASAGQGATITAGPATKVAITSAAIVDGAASTSATLGPLAVTRQDSFGNAATGGALAVTLASSSAGPAYFATTMSGTPTTYVLIASGQTGASFYYGDTKPGAPTITAGSVGLTSATQGQSIIAGPAAKLAITSGSITGAASELAARGPVTVQVRDIADNAVTTGAAVSLSSATSGTAIFSPTLNGATNAPTLTIAAGSSSRTFYYGDTKATGAGTVTVTAAAPGLTSATVAGSVSPAAASQLQYGQHPTTTAKSATITPAVTVRILDRFGNLTSSTASVGIAIATNGGEGLLGLGAGNLAGTTPRSAVAGVATFNDLRINGGVLNIGGEGTGYTLRVTSTGLSEAISNPFTIS